MFTALPDICSRNGVCCIAYVIILDFMLALWKRFLLSCGPCYLSALWMLLSSCGTVGSSGINWTLSCWQVHYFTHYMITIVNNCLQFVELAQLMKQHYWRPGLHDNEAGTKFEALLNTFQVNSICSTLTLRLLMSYIYGAPILDVSRSHTTTQQSR